jgi:hypothetical protein
MSNRWIIAMAAGASISMAVPAELDAQAGVARGKQSQQQRAAEREQQRDARQAAAQRDTRSISQRDARAANQRQDERDRYDSRRVADRDDRQRAAERERLRLERERQAQRDRQAAERQRQAELDRYRGQQRGWDTEGRSGKGPAFCRSGGAGHPVFGQRWCRDKGFGHGYDRWERDGWDDIVLRRPRQPDRQMGRSVLSDMLGSVVLGRFESYGRQYYGAGPVTGHWIEDRDAAVLQLSIGGVPFARIVDTSRNGRVDGVLLRR